MAEPAKKKSPNEDLIRSLANLLNETGLTEIEIEENNTRVRVARTLTMPSHSHAVFAYGARRRWRCHWRPRGTKPGKSSGRCDLADGGNGLPVLPSPAPRPLWRSAAWCGKGKRS